MKKLISFFICIVMTCSAAYGTEDIRRAAASDKNTSSVYEDDIEIIKALDIFSYYYSEHTDSDKVTRADFVKTIVELVVKEITAAGNTSVFSDVAAESLYSDALAYAKAARIIDGESSHEFNPDAIITVEQAYKIAVCAMGCKDWADWFGGYPTGYFKIAQMLKLNKGISANLSEPVTSGMMAKIILNIGFADPVNIKTEVNGVMLNASMTDTIFSSIHSIKKHEGVLKENQYTSLSSTAENPNGNILIGDFRGTCYNMTSAEKYLGYFVHCYYRDDSGEAYVLYIAPGVGDNETTAVSGEDIISFSVSDGILKYSTGKDGELSRTKVIPKSASVIYNGKLIMEYAESDFKDITGEVVLIDNNKDGIIDVVNILSYKIFVVNSTDLSEKCIYSLNDSSDKLYYSESGEWNSFLIWDDTYKRVDPESLKCKDVLTVIRSKDSKYVRAVLSRKTVSGILNAKEQRDNKNYITLDNDEYCIEDGCFKAEGDMLVLGKSLECYLDAYDRIAYISMGKAAEEFAAVIAISDSYGAFGGATVKLLTSDGSIKVYKLADRLTVDGVKSDNTKVPSSVKSSRVIRYRLNSEEELNWIDTPVKTDEDGGSIHVVSELDKVGYISPGRTFGGYFLLNNDMKIFCAPKDRGASNDEDYSIGSTSMFINTNKYSGEAYAVEKDALSVDAMIVLEDDLSSSLVHTSPTIIISKIYESISGDEEAVQIEGYDVDGNDVLITLLKTDKAYTAYQNSKLSIGDVAKYEVNSKGNVKEIEKIFDAKQQKLLHNLEAGRNIALTGLNSYVDSEFGCYLGKVLNRDGNIFKFKLDPELLAMPNNHLQEISYQDLGIENAKVIVVDMDQHKDDNKVQRGTVNDIQDEKHFFSAPNCLFMTKYAYIRVLVIYK